LPPIGYRIVGAEQRGSKTKKKLEIDPLHADTVRLIDPLFLEGNGTSGPMGVKAVAGYLNERGIFTRDGGRWGLAQIHAIVTARPISASTGSIRARSKRITETDQRLNRLFDAIESGVADLDAPG
jgi:hypothetical protein